MTEKTGVIGGVDLPERQSTQERIKLMSSQLSLLRRINFNEK